MKSFISTSFRSLAAASLIAAVCSITSASTLVCSNLVANNAGNVNRLTDSHGVPLAAGCRVQLGTFGNLSPAGISDLAHQGHQPLLAAFSPIGAASSIGSGSSSIAGRMEFSGSVPLSQPLSGLHVVVFNAPTPAAASEVLIAALPGTVPADDQSGLQGYLAVHLENATLVVGTAGVDGLSTAVVVSGFEAWMVGQNVSDIPPDQLLPGADADHDGVSNLVEYALGSLAVDPGSRANAGLVDDGDAIRLRFLGRNDDGDLSIAAETATLLDASAWSGFAGPLVEMVSPPSPAPAGYSWYEIVIPKSGSRLFARVRIVLDP
jgi:hypothetical protein